ncbi:hypothetical protein WDV06_00315 [Streptomyces racemochromogenes]|uniref:Integral membrane protein n=1 Tax=Streptomyces racemochromogenes TaxID=67353 RepID=A0ABW7P5R7_9ACTN
MDSPRRSTRAQATARPSGSGPAFWPFGVRTALVLVPVLLVVLTVAWGAGRTALGLESVDAGWALLVIVALSLLPVLLVVLSGLAPAGTRIEPAAVKAALTVAAASRRGPAVPRNVVPERGVPAAGPGGTEAVTSLRGLRGTEAVVVDLEDGHAWWEHRLLLLCAAAARLGSPAVVVFTAHQQGRPGRFVGWAAPADLLRCLQDGDPGLRKACLEAAGQAAGVRLAEASGPGPSARLMKELGLEGTRRLTHPPPRDALNPFLEEQLLARGLDRFDGSPDEIDVTRLRQLFTPVLHTRALEHTDADAAWLRAALLDDGDHIAFTDEGRYTGILPAAAVARAALLALLPPDPGA